MNHPEEQIIPATNDKIMTINNLSLNEIILRLDLVNLDEIQRLATANKKNIKPETINNLILAKRLIMKICENPRASNHK